MDRVRRLRRARDVRQQRDRDVLRGVRGAAVGHRFVRRQAVAARAAEGLHADAGEPRRRQRLDELAVHEAGEIGERRRRVRQVDASRLDVGRVIRVALIEAERIEADRGHAATDRSADLVAAARGASRRRGRCTRRLRGEGGARFIRSPGSRWGMRTCTRRCRPRRRRRRAAPAHTYQCEYQWGCSSACDVTTIVFASIEVLGIERGLDLARDRGGRRRAVELERLGDLLGDRRRRGAR